MKDLNEIYKYKDSDVAVFFGCGSSINRITKAQWRKICTFDTWTSNFFIYHDFVPKFYHLELKSGLPEHLRIWSERKQSKGEKYAEVKFVIMKDRAYLTDAIGEHEHVYCYERATGKCNPEEPFHPTILTHRCGASFTLILELLKKFGYKKIVLFGVDLRDSRYFWTDDSKYGEVHSNTNSGHKPDMQHTTAYEALEYIWGFNKYKMGGNLYVGHRDTLLYPGLKYIKITRST